MIKFDNSAYIGHIKESCESIFKFIEEKTFKEFANDDMLLSAVIRKIRDNR